MHAFMKNMLSGGRKDLIGFGKISANLCAAGGCLHLKVNKRHLGFLTLHLRGMQAEGSHFCEFGWCFVDGSAI